MKTAYLFLFTPILLAFGLSACGQHDQSHSDDEDHSRHDYHRLTHWENSTEVFARFEIHENSGWIEGTLFVSRNHSPAEELSGEIYLSGNSSETGSQELSNRRKGEYPFELFIGEADEAELAVRFRADGENYDLTLGTVHRRAVHPEEPDAEEIIELDKPMQWRMSVKSGAAEYHEIPGVVSGTGTVLHNPQYFHEITAPVSGHIDGNHIANVSASGSLIQSGDRLASISPSLSSENSWTEQRVTFQQAKEAYERARRLIENNAISLREYQEREREYEIRKAGYEHVINSSYHGARLEDGGSNLHLNAKQNGVIAETFVSPGREVKQGDLLFTLFDPSRLWVEVLAYRDELSGLPEITGMEVLTGRNQSLTLENSQISLVSRGLHSDASGNRSKITLAVENNEGLLSLNQPVRVRLKGNEYEQALTVPDGAIFDNESHKVVFVMHSGDQFERRMVQTGSSYGGQTAITDGLKEGERVVTKGVYPLHLMTGNVQIDDDHDH